MHSTPNPTRYLSAQERTSTYIAPIAEPETLTESEMLRNALRFTQKRTVKITDTVHRLASWGLVYGTLCKQKSWNRASSVPPIHYEAVTCLECRRKEKTMAIEAPRQLALILGQQR